MIRPAGHSDAMALTLSEIAFLLLSVSLVAAVMLAAALERSQAAREAARAEALRLEAALAEREAEVAELNAQLEELLGGVVACYRRPGSAVPPLVATLTIAGRDEIRIDTHGAADPHRTLELRTAPDTMQSDAQAALRSALATGLRAAAAESCYLRIAVRNETGSYSFYQHVEGAARDLGMVVVPH